MLLSFRMANHRSLYEERQLLLTPAYPADNPEVPDLEAVPVIGIFGPNASGKSNVLDALAFMRSMVRNSLRMSEPGGGIERHPFALDPDALQEPSSYVVDLLLDGIRFEYGFALDDDRVVEEWMYSHPLKQRRRIFHRTEDDFKYDRTRSPSMGQVKEITEPNVLFLSMAARSNQPEVLPVYNWFLRLIPTAGVFGRGSSPAISLRMIDEDDEYVTRLARLLRVADTGIESVELVEESEEEYMKRIADLPGSAGARARRAERERSGYIVTRRRRELFFRHRGQPGDVPLPMRDQSRGTLSLLELSRPVFQALDQGSTLVVDELDASLHPYLSAELIGLFRERSTNPNRAQLIFSSHDATLLGRIQGKEVLRRDHIWFTEKDEHGQTDLFPLTDFKPRKEENRELRYMAGRYGAVPVITDEVFKTVLDQRGTGEDVSPEP